MTSGLRYYASTINDCTTKQCNVLCMYKYYMPRPNMPKIYTNGKLSLKASAVHRVIIIYMSSRAKYQKWQRNCDLARLEFNSALPVALKLENSSLF